eukprot:7286152-Alexandrium_andersonii.AAC.1
MLRAGVHLHGVPAADQNAVRLGAPWVLIPLEWRVVHRRNGDALSRGRIGVQVRRIHLEGPRGRAEQPAVV